MENVLHTRSECAEQMRWQTASFEKGLKSTHLAVVVFSLSARLSTTSSGCGCCCGSRGRSSSSQKQISRLTGRQGAQEARSCSSSRSG